MDVSQGLEAVPVMIDSQAVKYLPNQFRYVRGNIPGPGYDTDEFDKLIEGCQCPHSCSDPVSCSCIKHGPSYHNSKLIQDLTTPVFECNSSCSCDVHCENRLVQHGLRTLIRVNKTEHRGLGAVTLETVHKGQFVCEYAGEILTKEEASRRTREQVGMNYIISCLEHGARITETYVDPRLFGNVGRFFNHSCDPNLVMVPVRVDNMIPKLCLFATRDISELEELNFSYGHCGGEPGAGAGAAGAGMVRKPCYCGADNCCGILPYDPHL